ncbi:MAG: Uma2 family endonuclease [Deltaproteobacteria bacterium]|nr:Uma2 family endonuclease [Deltaproteobacteria bacterium]
MSRASRESESEPLVSRPMSIDEWADLPEDEPGELVDGYLVEEEMPGLLHEIVLTWLVYSLRSWAAPRGGLVFGSEGKFAVAARRGRKPDLTMYLPGHPALPRRGAVRVPPDVAIEIVTPTPRDVRRDRVEKVEDYAGFGVRYYWIVDPEQQTFEILELGADGRYVRALGATGGILATVPGCADLTLDLDELWREGDKLGSAEPEPRSQP